MTHDEFSQLLTAYSNAMLEVAAGDVSAMLRVARAEGNMRVAVMRLIRERDGMKVQLQAAGALPEVPSPLPESGRQRLAREMSELTPEEIDVTLAQRQWPGQDTH